MGIYIGVGALLLVGSVMLLFALKLFYETIVFLRSAVRTVGTCIRLDGARNSDGQATSLPVFEYQTNDGTIYRYTSTVASTPPAYNVGDTATLLYHKRNPRNARINSFIEIWLVQLILAVLGLSCCLAAFFIFLSAK